MLNIFKVAIFILISLGVVKSKGLNKSILIDVHGYSTESVYMDLSERSIDFIEVGTFTGFN